MLRAISLVLCVILFPWSAYAESVDEAAASIVESFENMFGVTEGKRRNHTKGFCFEAEFIPAESAIRSYTVSPIFTQTSRVVGRLSHSGGNDTAADDKPGDYGLAIRIAPDDNVYIISANTLDFFPVSTPQAFAELMRAKAKGKEAVEAFAAKNPEFQAFKAHHSKRDKTLRPFEGSTYNSINSFYLIDDEGKRTAVRWSFVPTIEQEVVLAPTSDFFFENMQANLDAKGIVWDIIATIANDDDVIDNATIPWKGDRQKITVAKLKILSISTDQDGECDTINFDPSVLGEGLEPSEDPLLAARTIAYAISAGKRLSEKQKLRVPAD